jgi:hypothetical protein
MRRLLSALFFVWWASTVGSSATPATTPQNIPRTVSAASSPRTALNEYCVGCHNQRLKTAGLTLDLMDPANIGDDGERWEKVVRRLRTGTMPPQGVRRPDAAGYRQLIASLETALDGAAALRPYPGRPLLHRLNRAEYANTIRDLLALEVDAASLLPPDDSVYGFDNIADALGMSPIRLERYLVAASEISALAVGDPDVGPGSRTYRVRQDQSQDQHVEGLPLGTVGGIAVPHTFPLDGEYLLQPKLFRTNTNAMRGLEYPHQVEVTVDGERVLLAAIGGDQDFKELFKEDNQTQLGDAVDARLKVRVRINAGPHTVAAAFLQKTAAADTLQLRRYLRSSADTYDFTGQPHISTLTVTGPFSPTGAGETPSRRRIFICHPASPQDEAPCARKIVEKLGRRAFRQPLSEAEVAPLLTFYESGRREGTFETGIQSALQRILASPSFVFRAERDPDGLAPDAVYRLNDLELASRLSFFLWSSIPDDTLIAVASGGRLKTPAVLAEQVRRMLADPKAHALTTNFAGQWLQLRNLRNMIPNSADFPDFDDNLRQAFQQETELFFESIVREDRDAFDLMTADYTIVNERLAKHYRIPGVYGSYFRRVTLAEDARRGLLGKGGILMVTSHADRTSPVVRGKWILDNILGTPPPPPPPDVPALKDEGASGKHRSMREQMEEHRQNPACASCHKLMDPIGFAMENFDAVGAWRTSDAGARIDATGVLADGARVDSVTSLRRALMEHREVFLSTLTEKLLTYALGRGLDYHDMPAVRKIVRTAAASQSRFSSIIMGIVNSVPFQMRMSAAPEKEPGSVARVQAPAR